MPSTRARADIGIVAGHVSTGLETLPYFRDRLMLAVPKGHALARRRSLHFSEAIPFDFVGLGASGAMLGIGRRRCLR